MFSNTSKIHFTLTLTFYIHCGTGIRGLTTGLETLPQGNQEPLVVKTMMEVFPPGELGVSKSMECDTSPFSALRLLVGLHVL